MVSLSNWLSLIITTILLSTLLPNLLFSQSDQTRTISGSVLDKETGEPIPSVNVYISQTTMGTFTEDDGTFKFSTELSGIHTLVFSYVGYITEVREINLYKDEEFDFRIELETESLELQPLEITASNKEWQRDFEIFRRNFVGTTGAALNTEIENPWVISFERDDDRNLLAQAENSLSIKNYTLGYEMQVDLIEFRWPENRKSGYYLFYASYREIEPLSDKEQQSWERNRRNIYLGSFEHFLRCLYDNTLEECEFDVVVPNTNNSVEISEIDTQTTVRLGVYSDIPGLQPEEVKAYRLRFSVDVLYGKRRWFNPNRARLANPLSFRLDGVWSSYRIANLLPVNYQPEE